MTMHVRSTFQLNDPNIFLDSIYEEEEPFDQQFETRHGSGTPLYYRLFAHDGRLIDPRSRASRGGSSLVATKMSTGVPRIVRVNHDATNAYDDEDDNVSILALPLEYEPVDELELYMLSRRRISLFDKEEEEEPHGNEGQEAQISEDKGEYLIAHSHVGKLYYQGRTLYEV